jgi:hypothetical protein
MSTILRACIAAVALLFAAEADAQSLPEADAPSLKTNSIDIEYVEPKSPEHKPVFELVKEYRALERVRELLSPMRLPRRLLMKTEGCDGEVNAWYDGESVTVCYEYLDDLWKKVPETTTRSGLAPIDALLGPVLDVFFHEAGHALFDILSIPLLGREEDAADQFSSYIMLRFPKEEARRMIMGSAYQYRADVRIPTVTMPQQKFADEHGTPSQRFYNLLCIAYGADKELFGDFVAKGFLPQKRAEGCEDEYKQVDFAIRNLIVPHVDRTLARQLNKTWLPPVTAQPKRRM